MQGLSTANLSPCRADSVSQHHSKGSLEREKRWLFSHLPVTFPSGNRRVISHLSLPDTISTLPTSNPERKRKKMLVQGHEQRQYLSAVPPQGHRTGINSIPLLPPSWKENILLL